MCDEPADIGGECNWNAEPARDDHPVNCVSWDDAERFAEYVGRWLPGARLPTEAEWEYAARDGGRDVAYPWGDAQVSCERAVVGGCGGAGTTVPVCSKPVGSTSAGVCDLEGNVVEWVADDWHRGFEGAPTDGSAWIDSPRGASRVVRGGAYRIVPRKARAAGRNGLTPGFRSDDLGFRLSRSLLNRPVFPGDPGL